MTPLTVSQLQYNRKRRECGDLVWEVELFFFTLLVFANTGGMGKEALKFAIWLICFPIIA